VLAFARPSPVFGLQSFRAPNSEEFLLRERPSGKNAAEQRFSGKSKRGFVNSERLQFLAGLEAHCFAGRDADFLACAGIPADAGLAGAHVKHSEAPQFNSFTFSERFLHGFKNGFDGLLRFGPAHAGLIYDCINDIQLNHSILLRFDGKLC
jgi:hypothetical protein